MELKDYIQNSEAIKTVAEDVFAALGPDHEENFYEKAMIVAFQQYGIPFRCQPDIPVGYRGICIGVERPDFFVGEGDDRTIVELKATSRLGNHERSQVRRYMRLTGIPAACLINFPIVNEEIEFETVYPGIITSPITSKGDWRK